MASVGFFNSFALFRVFLKIHFNSSENVSDLIKEMKSLHRLTILFP